MNCMKCGREFAGEGVFCAECLEEMDRYPVKPGTVVHLPRRKAESVVKKPSSRKKAYQNPEEQVKNLRKLVLRLSLALAVCLMLLIGTGYFAVVHLLESDQTFLPGQNYSTVDSTAGNLDA